MKKFFSRLSAAALVLALLCTPAFALTPQQAGELLNLYYVDEVPQRVLEQTTVESMLAELGDPYTQYFDADTYQLFLDSMRDANLTGIGVSMQMEAEGALITQVIADTAAEEAGLLPGDIITAVDGNAAAGAALEQIKAWVTGEEGTSVTVTVLRDGRSRDYMLVRRVVVIPATETTLLDGHIGYIRCTTFGQETLGHFEDGISANDGAVDRWIVDLRGNGGGEINAAVQSAGAFAGSGNLLYRRDNEGLYGVYRREAGQSSLDPVVVLVNGDTASSSEIFASIIRDQQAGIVVGSRTYGKGVAQVLLDGESYEDCFGEGDALKVTAYRFFSPLGATNDKIGIIPHLLVDDAYAADVAYLLAGSNPKGDTGGMLRVDMKWRWYVDLETAASDAGKPAFTALLEALPPSANLWLGTGGAEGWRETTAAELVEEYGLTGYASRAFTDLADEPFADAINTLAAYDIVSGSGDGTFRPDGELTRAQFCVLLANAMRYTTSRTGSAFADVKSGEWYAPAVNALYEQGIVSGYSDGLFHPDDPMDHSQFLTILGRVAPELCMNFHDAAGSEHTAGLGDYWAWPAWSRESMWLLDGSQANLFGQSMSLLWDTLDSIQPDGVTTRREAAVMVYNLLIAARILPA
ncbi:S41 family peptidase [Lawsonibacter faecis]|uniref:S-layer homology domain-containing protein n=1 Tax=Lawsonibacter faecis TaxID=2763052 RepID=A0A8J6MD71_9FIRM|nr:S41 family peptidase [Lawsonibacter faecis]MBC5737254.1 S-layer homology domain-containing protein [Lawsonibacter faecis]